MQACCVSFLYSQKFACKHAVGSQARWQVAIALYCVCHEPNGCAAVIAKGGQSWCKYLEPVSGWVQAIGVRFFVNIHVGWEHLYTQYCRGFSFRRIVIMRRVHTLEHIRT